MAWNAFLLRAEIAREFRLSASHWVALEQAIDLRHARGSAQDRWSRSAEGREYRSRPADWVKCGGCGKAFRRTRAQRDSATRASVCSKRCAAIFGNAVRGPQGRQYVHNGESHTAAEWSGITGIPLPVLRDRLARGWDVSRALTQAPGDVRRPKGSLIAAHGRSMSVAEWSALTGVDPNTIRARMRRGWCPDRAVGPKP